MAAKINIPSLAGKKLLVAPLDWGLGHATRCIPIIHQLLKNDCRIWLAGEGAQEALLRKEFPQLPFLSLPGYRIQYARSALAGKLLLQIPKILSSIQYENNWLKKQVSQYGFEAVISDNRYGLYHKNLFSVFITHQLSIKSPWGRWSEKIIQQWNYSLIRRFQECWIPDYAGENNLAGDLSHPEKMPPVPVIYTGPLSRFMEKKQTDWNTENKNDSEENPHLLVLLSGPEPQRSMLENHLLKQLPSYPGTATVVRGLPASDFTVPSTGPICFYNHLPTDLLVAEMQKAAFLISRPGYSTVMDIAFLKKKSILIPTPGQTEQEYLAIHLQKKKFAFCIHQNAFSLQKALKEARQFPYHL